MRVWSFKASKQVNPYLGLLYKTRCRQAFSLIAKSQTTIEGNEKRMANDMAALDALTWYSEEVHVFILPVRQLEVEGRIDTSGDV